MLLATSAAAAPPYAGRPVDAALRELAAAADIRLVYTARLVPAGSRVTREPPPGRSLEVIATLVAPLGLVLRQVDERTYALVHRDDARVTPVAPSSRGAPDTEPVSEVVVSASRYALATDVPDVHTLLTQGEIDALPRMAEDALKAVHRLPGAASNGLAGLAHLRGGDTDETLVMFDGLPLHEPFHLRLLQGPVSVLDERVIGTLDVHAGAFTADLGDRMSGILDVRSLHPDSDAYYELGLSLLHSGGLASHRFDDGRGQWLVSMRRSNLDELADWSKSDLGEAHYTDGFARLDYAWSPATRASAHVLVASDSAQVANSAGSENADVEYTNRYLWGTLEHDWTDRFATTALVSYTDVYSERLATVDEPGLRTGRADDRRDYDVLGFRLDARHGTERWLQRAGIEGRSLSARYDYRGEVAFAPSYPYPGATSFRRELAPQPSGRFAAAYYTMRGQLTDAFTAEAGLRWAWQTYAPGDDQLSPRLNLAWRLGNRTRLLASWGRYEQFQGIEELAVEDGVDRFARAQYADQVIVGIEHRWQDGLDLRVEAYRKDYGRPRTRFENLYDPLSLAPELRWDRVAVEPTSARTEGVELLVTWRALESWNAWSSYAWSRATDRLGGRDVRRSWDQTHTVNAGLGWTSGPWRATCAGQYHTGWPVTPVDVNAAGEVVVGARNDDRYGDFGSVDARLSYEWTLSRGALVAHVEVTNVLNRRNPCCTDLTYRIDADGTATLDRELRHWLPLVPSVGVLWKF